MKHILATLAFYAKHSNQHHSFANNRTMIRAIKSLEKNGYLKVDWNSNTAIFSGKVFADR